MLFKKKLRDHWIFESSLSEIHFAIKFLLEWLFIDIVCPKGTLTHIKREFFFIKLSDLGFMMHDVRDFIIVFCPTLQFLMNSKCAFMMGCGGKFSFFLVKWRGKSTNEFSKKSWPGKHVLPINKFFGFCWCFSGFCNGRRKLGVVVKVFRISLVIWRQFFNESF